MKKVLAGVLLFSMMFVSTSIAYQIEEGEVVAFGCLDVPDPFAICETIGSDCGIQANDGSFPDSCVQGRRFVAEGLGYWLNTGCDCE